ncbi:hypothetical protein LINGRAPRIM_LOCUS3380 [Linum grandiflorum]
MLRRKERVGEERGAAAAVAGSLRERGSSGRCGRGLEKEKKEVVGSGARRSSVEIGCVSRRGFDAERSHACQRVDTRGSVPKTESPRLLEELPESGFGVAGVSSAATSSSEKKNDRFAIKGSSVTVLDICLNL